MRWTRGFSAALLMLLATQSPTFALPPPGGGSAHGAAGSGRNGFGGEIAASATMASWPGTGARNNGGAFGFVGAQYGALWNIPAGSNNSRGVGYCVMEDVDGEGQVSLRPDPSLWDTTEMARAAALMATFGGDRVVPYGVNHVGGYDDSTGEWTHPFLFSAGEFTRRRHVAVNFGVRMFLEDVSPSGVAGGRKLARDTAVINGTRGEFEALRNGYLMAQYMAKVAELQSAVGGVTLTMVWGTLNGARPTKPGTYPVEVRAIDGSGKPVGLVPVLQLSGTGIDANRSTATVAHVDNAADTPADLARWNAAAKAGWPVWGMNRRLDMDPRFSIDSDSRSADVTDSKGVARFNVTITRVDWELAFHAQAPTADVGHYAGSGIQGQVTWIGRPQSASVHQQHVVPDTFIRVVKTSTDPAVGVAGTRFGLYDGSGDEVGQATVGAHGRADFPGFSPSVFEPPYVVREIRAAPGLQPIARDIKVPITPALSTDPFRPTIVAVTNIATVGRFTVRKLLDDVGVQGNRDMSGFGFAVTQVATGRRLGTFVTGADGRTPPVEAVLGTYRVTETGRPPWATALIDSGSITFEFDPTKPGSSNRVAEIAYTNRVPEVSIDTAASISNGRVTDVVSYCGLVPGTAYIVSGSLRVIADDATPDGSDDVRTTPSGVEATTTFVPTATCGVVNVSFDSIPPGSLAGRVAVIFEEVTLAATGTLVAWHADPTDAAQTVSFPAVVTTSTVPPTIPSTVPPTVASSIPPTVPSTIAPIISATVPPTIEAGTTTTTALAVVVKPTPPKDLPRTGGGHGTSRLVLLGEFLALAGAVLVVASRRSPGETGTVEDRPD